uniref:Integrator complex subunit 3 N-terminal domain-containing protein n=2 Tax=Brassica oleracea TaxID=3712 RepID=A0A0D3CSL9_BRAOL|nr:unnamed protein product [Brassica oleracea]
MENENLLAASKLIRVALHEVESQLELSLRQANESLKPKLRPPFSLEIPDPQEPSSTASYAIPLVDSAKIQLMWLTKEMISVSSVGLEDLLRRIGSGDQNVWLCSELDHCKVSGDNVKRLEMKFCVKMFREEMDLSLKIGRDLVRLLQDLAHVSEFREIGTIWSQVFITCPRLQLDIYFFLRISPEMETQLRFLLGNVKLGSHKRHQIWFLNNFLVGNGKQVLLTDKVRFICCVIHPTNEIIRSEIMPRWAVIGWFLELSRQNQGSVKLALFYDWLFFDETICNIIMNVKPAALDGVASAFRAIERKGVIRSLDIFLSSPALAPDQKKKLANLLSCHQEKVPPLNLLQPSVGPLIRVVEPAKADHKLDNSVVYSSRVLHLHQTRCRAANSSRRAGDFRSLALSAKSSLESSRSLGSRVNEPSLFVVIMCLDNCLVGLLGGSDPCPTVFSLSSSSASHSSFLVLDFENVVAKATESKAVAKATESSPARVVESNSPSDIE